MVMRRKGFMEMCWAQQVDEVGIEQERMGYLRQVVQQKRRHGGGEHQSHSINRE